MVEFNFDLKPLFPDEIIKISSHDLEQVDYFLDPEGWFKISQIETIINHLGELSAVAQGLKGPITTADKLRTSDNTKLYLMATSKERGGKMVAVGLLKIGKKDLFLYDELKQQRKVRQVPCILDFYIYDSCQRCGYGKRLFEKMLKEENLNPNKCSIDRPSEKLRGFLKKHYGLEKTIPQGYKFVLYKGFFDDQRGHSTQKEDEYTVPNNSGQGNRLDKTVIKKPALTSISSEHFGGCLGVRHFKYSGGYNQKITNHCVTK